MPYMEKLKPNNQVRRAVTSCKLGKTMKVYNPNIWETFYSHFSRAHNHLEVQANP